MDEFEAHKCRDFKRMMLESVPEGGVVGLPVPLGYDDVLVNIFFNKGFHWFTLCKFRILSF